MSCLLLQLTLSSPSPSLSRTTVKKIANNVNSSISFWRHGVIMSLECLAIWRTSRLLWFRKLLLPLPTSLLYMSVGLFKASLTLMFRLVLQLVPARFLTIELRESNSSPFSSPLHPVRMRQTGSRGSGLPWVASFDYWHKVWFSVGHVTDWSGTALVVLEELGTTHSCLFTDSLNSVCTLEKPFQASQKFLSLYVHYIREFQDGYRLAGLYIRRESYAWWSFRMFETMISLKRVFQNQKYV